jgi:hypothetical protein
MMAVRAVFMKAAVQCTAAAARALLMVEADTGIRTQISTCGQKSNKVVLTKLRRWLTCGPTENGPQQIAVLNTKEDVSWPAKQSGKMSVESNKK